MSPRNSKPAQNIRLEAVEEEYRRLESGPGSKVDKLTNAFIKTMEAGFWRPGDRVPTEVHLTEALPLSLGTIQAALGRLVKQGIIVRRRGLGSRIAGIDEKGQDNWFMCFLDEKDAKLELRFIEVEETDDEGPWSDFLGQGSDYIRIERIMAAARSFPILAVMHLNAGRFRPLLDYDPKTFGRVHMRHILQHRFNAPSLSFSQNIRVVDLDDETCAKVELEPGSVAMEMEIQCRTFRNEPLFYQVFTVPPSPRWISVRPSSTS